MDYSDPINPLIPTIVGSGIVGLLITIGIAIVGFIISAFITSFWVRLILVFMRRALDREYDRMRAAGRGYQPSESLFGPITPPMPNKPEAGPRDW